MISRHICEAFQKVVRYQRSQQGEQLRDSGSRISSKSHLSFFISVSECVAFLDVFVSSEPTSPPPSPHLTFKGPTIRTFSPLSPPLFWLIWAEVKVLWGMFVTADRSCSLYRKLKELLSKYFLPGLTQRLKLVSQANPRHVWKGLICSLTTEQQARQWPLVWATIVTSQRANLTSDSPLSLSRVWLLRNLVCVPDVPLTEACSNQSSFSR